MSTEIAVAAAAPPVIPAGASPAETYARWFVSARHQGASVDQGRVVATNATGLKISRKLKELCYWYEWAADQGVADERRLEVASAGAMSMERGMDLLQAAGVALAYSRGDRTVRLGLPPIPRLVKAGLFHLLWAGVVFAAGLVLSLRDAAFVIAVGAGLGLLASFSASALRWRFPRLMGVAMLVNVASFALLYARNRFGF
jgi:hypothetical protein